MMQFELADQSDESNRAIIKSGVKRFNDENAPALRALRQSGKQVLDIFIRDPNSKIVGGLVGNTYWQWLYIDELWLAGQYRKQGYGRKLVALAEAEAKNRGCTAVHVKTWSFQAKGFYERLGFKVVGELQDYPPGENLYWMHKSI